MLTLQVKEKHIENLTPEEEFIRGTVGAECQIDLDAFWQGYENTVVFKRENDCTVYNVAIDSLSNRVEIPYTILAESGSFKVGLFGVKPDEVLPTLWSDYIKVRYGTDTHGTTPPKYEPNEIDQLRLSKQDKLTAGDNITIDENNVISATGGTVDDVQINGNSVVTNGVANIPIATNTIYGETPKLGVVGVRNSTYGIGITTDGLLQIRNTNNENINQRNSWSWRYYNALTLDKIDYAVKAAMCDGQGAEWTVEEKTAARDRMGIDKCRLVAEVTLEDNVNAIYIDTDNDGNTFSLKEMYVVVSGSQSASELCNFGIAKQLHFIHFNFLDTINSSTIITCNKVGNNKCLMSVSACNRQGGYVYNSKNTSSVLNTGEINCFYATTIKTEITFNIGTKIEIWGVDE